MPYDPFARGPFPVGVSTRKLTDPPRDRSLEVELWYPADDAHRGRDLDRNTRDTFDVLPGFPVGWQAAVRDAKPGKGSFPVVGFSHGFGTQRRQSTFLCTHLASHGYVVVAPDHTGNTMFDVMGAFMKAMSGGPAPDVMSSVGEVARARPEDLLFAVRSLDAFGDAGALGNVDVLGLCGHSFGGWTALTATARDARVRAVLGLAPAGGRSQRVAQELSDHIELDYAHEVVSQLVVADRDSIISFESVCDLYGRMGGDKRMFVLTNTDHMHFSDRPRAAHEMFRMVPGLAAALKVENMPPFSELSPAEPALTALRGLGLAHFDAALKANAEADAFVRDRAVSELSRRGIEADRR